MNETNLSKTNGKAIYFYWGVTRDAIFIVNKNGFIHSYSFQDILDSTNKCNSFLRDWEG